MLHGFDAATFTVWPSAFMIRHAGYPIDRMCNAVQVLSALSSTLRQRRRYSRIEFTIPTRDARGASHQSLP